MLYTVGQRSIYSQPPIVQVLPLKKERPVIFIMGTNKIRKENHIVGFLIHVFANYGGKYLVNNKSLFISILCYIPFVGNDRGEDIQKTCDKVFTHCCWYFGPFLHADLL
jgi:hypothetical protein